MAHVHLSLQILFFFKKNCFAEYLVLRLNFTLSSIVFVNFLLVLREKSFFANHEVKKYSRIGSDEYSFECALKLSSPFTHGQIANGQLTNQSARFTSVML